MEISYQIDTHSMIKTNPVRRNGAFIWKAGMKYSFPMVCYSLSKTIFKIICIINFDDILRYYMQLLCFYIKKYFTLQGLN